MLDFLLEIAIEYGLEWLYDTVVDELGNFIHSLVTDNDGLTDALIEYLPTFSWHKDSEGEVVNELGQPITSIIERFKHNWELLHNDNPDDDLPVTSNGVIDTDLEHMQYQALTQQSEIQKDVSSSTHSISAICTIALFCGLFSLFTSVLNYTKNYIYKKCYKGKENN